MNQANMQNKSSPSLSIRQRRLVDHSRNRGSLSDSDSSLTENPSDGDSQHFGSSATTTTTTTTGGKKPLDGMTQPIDIPTFRSFRSSEKIRFDLRRDEVGSCSLQEGDDDVVQFFLKVEPREIRQKKSSSERVKILRDTFNKKGNSMRSIGRPPSLADTIKKISRPRSLPCLSGTPTQ
eukprot:CAMPEP_0116832880 /NCGR_PEP_ID=MMETSP0418-20121206/6131_1 /TAXON_ID=1158023 /ORGANISM="Astrosyne radiata, Strain 13vi08-1A" /LENGTH=177 /DNA_ID=CAMNT_0004462277 /DNA_START=216 /DNA_END=752 /DNA_ORIENTATION=-